MKIKYYIIITTLLLSITCQADLNKKIDNLFKKWNNPNSPGCAVAVVKDQKNIYEKGFGSANLQYKIPITSDTVFAGASISKQFTAFAIALLVKKGEINLNDNIKKYLPWLPNIAENITVKNLIYHTDGLRDQWDLLTFAGWNLYTDIATNKDIVNLVKMQRKLNFIPGTEYLYGNTGYTLLAQIVEKVSGESFPGFCNMNIFTPLGMKHTFFNNNCKRVITNLAESYTQKNKKKYNRSPYNISTYGATGLYTTLEDMIKWSNNFYSHKVGGIKIFNLITKSGLLKSGKSINYGFGLEIKKYKGHNYIAHAGADAGYNNYFITFPKENISIVILSNISTINASVLAFKIADFLIPSIKDKNKKLSCTDKNINYKNLTGYFYSRETGTELRVTSENNNLYAELLGQKFKLMNIKNEVFIVAQIPSVSFKFDKNGNILEYNNNLEGISINLKKVGEANLKLDKQRDYTGKYYCPELNVTYQIKDSCNKLTMLRPRFIESQLTPVFKDYFSANNGFWGMPYSVVFNKNNKGEIIGFNISTSIVTNRVRNLYFEKIK